MRKKSIGISALGKLFLIVFLLIAGVDKVGAQPIPKNAQVYGQGWTCKLGFKKQGNGCVEMSVAEKALQLKQIRAAIAASKNQTIRIDDEEFSLRDVERKCEVYRYSENYGDVECRGLRIVERKCEAYFSGYGDREGDIECSGSDLRAIEQHCVANMYSDSYAEIDC